MIEMYMTTGYITAVYMTAAYMTALYMNALFVAEVPTLLLESVTGALYLELPSNICPRGSPGP